MNQSPIPVRRDGRDAPTNSGPMVVPLATSPPARERCPHGHHIPVSVLSMSPARLNDAARQMHVLRDERLNSGSATTILPFERLQCFEDVADRFADLGLHFANAIALVPSNPRYPATNHEQVIVSAPHNGALEIYFDRPVVSVTACVTSSRSMTMSARDSQKAVIARSRIAASNLHGTNSAIAANHPLIVMAPAIHSVTFSAFDGQIAIGDLCVHWETHAA